MRDFTLERYAALLRSIAGTGLPVYGVRAWVNASPQRGILLRHDVDRRAPNALAMAELEATHGVASTYYFRITPGSFQPEVIRRIHALGHEIGYHYEDLSLARGDRERAIALFRQHLAALRSLAPVSTIAMHGSPLSPYDNRDLWQNERIADHGIAAEALASIDYSGVYYLTDTGRSWSEQSVNLRDHVPNARVAPVHSTQDLCRFIEANPQERFAIGCHPERWDASLPHWAVQYSKDHAINLIKHALRFARRRCYAAPAQPA